MLWRDTQMRIAILGVDAPAWATLLLPAVFLHVWTILFSLSSIAGMGIVRLFGITPVYLLRLMRLRLIGRVRPTLLRPNLWRARMRRL